MRGGIYVSVGHGVRIFKLLYWTVIVSLVVLLQANIMLCLLSCYLVSCKAVDSRRDVAK